MRQAELSADQDWRQRVEEAIVALAACGETFCADQVREQAGDPPPSTSPNALGALVNRMARLGVIQMVGFTRSERICGHNNTVRLWRGAR